MSDKFKTPNNGFQVTVLRMTDVINTLDDNIDKDIVKEIITHCEKKAAKDLVAGIWVGIPFIGNIRISKYNQLLREKETQELIQEAKETLDKKDYINFRIDLTKDLSVKAKVSKLHNYNLSKIVTKNKKPYNNLVKHKGVDFAKIYLYSLTNLTYVEPIIEDYE